MNLHPELNKMYSQFNKLIDDVEAGHIQYDDALAILSSLSTVDSDGAVWSIDTDGVFHKALPGDSPRPADPIHFKSGFIEFNPSPWGGFDIASPPVRGGVNSYEEDYNSEEYSQVLENSSVSDFSRGNLSTDSEDVSTPKRFGLPSFSKKSILLSLVIVFLLGLGYFNGASDSNNPSAVVEESLNITDSEDSSGVNTEESSLDEKASDTADGSSVDVSSNKVKSKVASKGDVLYLAESLISDEQFIRELVIAESNDQKSLLWSAMIFGGKEAGLKFTASGSKDNKNVLVKIEHEGEVVFKDTIKVVFKDNEFLLERFPSIL
jgi:hypothetical protein